MFKNFTAQEWITLILAVLGVGYIVLLFINQSWGKLRELAYQGMLIAEQYYHSGEGKQKFEMAFTYLWSLVPRWMKIFITENPDIYDLYDCGMKKSSPFKIKLTGLNKTAN
jgi:uncharacterized membrane protein